MGIQDIARDDFNEFLSDLDGFGQDITLITPAPTKNEYTVSVYHTIHRSGYSDQGVLVNTQQISIAIPEKTLIAASYPYLNSDLEVDLLNHTCKIKDVTGVEKHYMVAQQYPDRELGSIIVFLQDYTAP